MRFTKSVISAAIVAGAATLLVGCNADSSNGMSAKSGNPTMGMSDHNKQRYSEWYTSNIEHEWWDTQVVYHPEADVYFDPYNKLYYFKQSDGKWTQSAQLPSHFTLLRSTRIIVPRRDVLKATGNAEYAMSFNPSFTPFEEDLSDVLRAADDQLDYADRPSVANADDQ